MFNPSNEHEARRIVLRNMRHGRLSSTRSLQTQRWSVVQTGPLTTGCFTLSGQENIKQLSRDDDKSKDEKTSLQKLNSIA